MTTSSPHPRRNQLAGPSKKELLRGAHALLEAAGVERGPSWIARTVHAYLNAPVAGLPFGMYLAARVELNDQQRRRLEERADLRYLLTYADPTGEVAGRRVARSRGEEW